METEKNNIPVPGPDEISRLKKLRHRILTLMYARFREVPYAAIELQEISTECEVLPQELNWNLVYLEKKGCIELSKNSDSFPFIACSATITAHGIDQVETSERHPACEVNERFPGD